MFSEPDDGPGGSALPAELRGRPVYAAAAGVAAVGFGAAVLLARVPGRPWRSLYAEDRGVFLADALGHPWHVFAPYAGYLELLQRLVAQLTSYLPLADAAFAFALVSAAVAAGCALFIFHASAGHIRSAGWRALLAAAVILLPVAPLEIADNLVNAPWYLILALFWAVLWRPRTLWGMAVAALIGFFAAASDPLAVVLAPLFAARLFALRRPREHAVTAGWAVGCLLQVPVVLHASAAATHSRVAKPVPFGKTLAFYGHDVVLPALGWHLDWHLQALAGKNGATLITGLVLAAIFAAIIVTQRGRVRLFVVTALITGVVYTLVAATFAGLVPIQPVTEMYEPGSRYTTLPIFLFGCAAIVAVDTITRRAGLRAVVAGAALVAVLAIGWVPDFRFVTNRSSVGAWAPVAATWLHYCERPGVRDVIVPSWGSNGPVAIPCANLRR